MSDQTPASRCPTCRKPTATEHRPFCSKRCADIDLARWLGGTFVIPGAALDLSDDNIMPSGPSGSDDDDTRGRKDN